MVNLIDLIETEDTTMTNPGGYMGPEVTPFGVVADNRDDVTHTPETEAEYRKRKKRKEQQLNPNEGSSTSGERAEENYKAVVLAIAGSLLETEGTIGPISKEGEKELKKFPKKEVEKGIKREGEHTKNKQVAKNIVDDHLREKENYYELLDKYGEGNKGKTS